MRRTKIVATIGPSSNSEECIRTLIFEGMNVARINFSHGAHKQHKQTIRRIRKVSQALGKDVGTMVDLQGPKIRTGKLAEGGTVQLVHGAEICITTRDVGGSAEIVSTTYASLPEDVKSGDHIFISDGTLELEVERVEGSDTHCRVLHGGYLGEHKGINLPGVDISAPSLTEKDVEDLEFALTLPIDFIALSFVRTGDDVRDLKRRIEESGKTVAVIAKLERPEALENLDDILEVTDCAMLARGDLGVEVPMHVLPQIQKQVLGQCNDLGVPVITATQMMESMIACVRPTRAEVADVANAIYDGTDALMLSAETASGAYPVEAVRAMAEVATSADEATLASPTHERMSRQRGSHIREGQAAFGDAIGQAVCRTAEVVGARCVVTFTKMGFTANLIGRYRPNVPIYSITLSEEARRRCSIIWGVDAIMSIRSAPTDKLAKIVDEALLSGGFAEKGDIVVLAGGTPLAIRTRTNMLKLHTVGEEA
jgi:pyruvate kinase